MISATQIRLIWYWILFQAWWTMFHRGLPHFWAWCLLKSSCISRFFISCAGSNYWSQIICIGLNPFSSLSLWLGIVHHLNWIDCFRVNIWVLASYLSWLFFAPYSFFSFLNRWIFFNHNLRLLSMRLRNRIWGDYLIWWLGFKRLIKSWELEVFIEFFIIPLGLWSSCFENIWLIVVCRVVQRFISFLLHWTFRLLILYCWFLCCCLWLIELLGNWGCTRFIFLWGFKDWGLCNIMNVAWWSIS